jgi:2-haloacid dehalogenase
MAWLPRSLRVSAESIEAAVFDIGGVLIDWNPRHLYRTIFSDPAEMERFLKEVCTLEWHAQHDLGRCTSETTAELIAVHPSFAAEIQAYSDRFPEMWSGAIEESVEILLQVQREGVRTYAATNWSDEFWPLAVRTFPFLKSFDGALVSGEIGVCKPDKEFYLRLINEFRLDPQRTLYIDDSSANVAAASELGFVVHHFKSPKQLREALAAIGGLSPS